MARAKAVLQSEFPYTISGRCINKDWFNLPMPLVWAIYCEELTKAHFEHKLFIHSFVLMSNHFHLIASTPEANISTCMHQFMGRTSRRLTRAGNRINQTYAGRHFKCVLQQHSYYLNTYKYNYRNPVEAGICNLVEEYPFSTIQMLLDPSKNEIPLVEDTTFRCDPQGTLAWLNTPPPPEKLNCIRIATKHSYFKATKRRKDGKPTIGVDEVI